MAVRVLSSGVNRKSMANPPATTPTHQPVLLRRCVELLAPALEAPGAVLVDATLGLGGHTEAFLQEFPELTVVGIDRDPKARELAGKRLAPFADRLHIAAATYDEIPEVLEELGLTANAILADLGVSSMQLDLPERGFSYSADAPLDMRMDTSSGFTAAQLLAEAPAAELRGILALWGEERQAHRIARLIVDTRAEAPLTRTSQLVEIIRRAIPAAQRRHGGHPAKRTFQALRIAVNGELEILERALPKALGCLPIGGRMAVEAYQSLEDRLVKKCFATGIKPPLPEPLAKVLPDPDPWLRPLTKGALRAEAEENNPRAESVRLRAVEVIGPIPENAYSLGETTQFPTLAKLREQYSSTPRRLQ